MNSEADPSHASSWQPTYSPNCQWLDTESTPLLLPTGKPLKVEDIPAGVLSKEDLTVFYCCSQCGKIFWEGSHFGRMVSQFKVVLDLSEDSQDFYKQS